MAKNFDGVFDEIGILSTLSRHILPILFFRPEAWLMRTAIPTKRIASFVAIIWDTTYTLSNLDESSSYF